MSDYRNCFWPDPCKPISPPSTPCYPPCPPSTPCYPPCPPTPCCPPVNVCCGDSDHKKPWIPSYAFSVAPKAQALSSGADTIDLSGGGPSTDDITASVSGLKFSKYGLYAVWYSVSLDTAAAPTANLIVGLKLDGSLITSSTFTTGTGDYNYNKMAIVPVAGAQTLAIVLTNPGANTLKVVQASILVHKIA